VFGPVIRRSEFSPLFLTRLIEGKVAEAEFGR